MARLRQIQPPAIASTETVAASEASCGSSGGLGDVALLARLFEPAGCRLLCVRCGVVIVAMAYANTSEEFAVAVEEDHADHAQAEREDRQAW